jgi:hypothetical protein
MFNPQLTNLPVQTVSTGLPDNTVYAMPFFVGRLGRQVSALGVVVTSSPGGVVKVGIYDVLPPLEYDVYPRNLVLSANIDVSATGLRTASASKFLENGLYWLVLGKQSGNQQFKAHHVLSGANFESAVGRSPLQWASGSSINRFLSLGLTNASPLPERFPTGAVVYSSYMPTILVL